MTHKIAVILSGCGVFDGSEIYETTLTLLHITKNGFSYECLAPNVPQHHVLDHQNGTEMPETRNVLTESARLARGAVKDIAEANIADYAAVILPGGFGAAKNLSNLAYENDVEKLVVEPTTQKFLEAAFAAKLPMGFICISPASVAAVAFKGKGLRLTIGHDAGTIKIIKALGHTHQEANADQIVVDEAHRIVTTPAYMCGQNLAEVELGIAKLVAQVTAYVTRLQKVI